VTLLEEGCTTNLKPDPNSFKVGLLVFFEVLLELIGNNFRAVVNYRYIFFKIILNNASTQTTLQTLITV
jgi:hypothetical protein